MSALQTSEIFSPRVHNLKLSVSTIVAALCLSAAVVAASPAQSQTVTTIHSFKGTDGANPGNVTLTQGRDGKLYGTTRLGGSNDLGVVFKITTTGAEQVLYNFDGAHGAHPAGGLTLGRDGSFYGTTEFGGATNSGVMFKITSNGILTVLHDFTGGSDGLTPFSAPIPAFDDNFYGTTSGENTSALSTVYKLTPSGAFTTLHTFATIEGWHITPS